MKVFVSIIEANGKKLYKGKISENDSRFVSSKDIEFLSGSVVGFLVKLKSILPKSKRLVTLNFESLVKDPGERKLKTNERLEFTEYM